MIFIRSSVSVNLTMLCCDPIERIVSLNLAVLIAKHFIPSSSCTSSIDKKQLQQPQQDSPLEPDSRNLLIYSLAEFICVYVALSNLRPYFPTSTLPVVVESAEFTDFAHFHRAQSVTASACTRANWHWNSQ